MPELIQDLLAGFIEMRERRSQRARRKRALKSLGIGEPLRCPNCGFREDREEHANCWGVAWYSALDGTGRPQGINKALWIAYQRDLIPRPLFRLTGAENAAWDDDGGNIARE